MCINNDDWDELNEKVGSVQKKQDICFAVTEEKFSKLHKDMDKLHDDIKKINEKFKSFDEMPAKIYGILTKFLAGALSLGLIVFSAIFFWINANYKHYTTDILDLKTTKLTYQLEKHTEKITELETKLDRLDQKMQISIQDVLISATKKDGQK